MSRRDIDLYCIQEVHCRSMSARSIAGKDDWYKFFWVGNHAGTAGVGVVLSEKWVEKVFWWQSCFTSHFVAFYDNPKS